MTRPVFECPSCGEADPFACGCPQPFAFAVHSNATTCLDRIAPGGKAGDGVIGRRHGLGWGMYPLTPAGYAEACADAAENDDDARRVCGLDTIGDGPGQVPPSVVLVVDASGDIIEPAHAEADAAGDAFVMLADVVRLLGVAGIPSTHEYPGVVVFETPDGVEWATGLTGWHVCRWDGGSVADFPDAGLVALEDGGRIDAGSVAVLIVAAVGRYAAGVRS